MNPWEIVAEEDKNISGYRHRLVLLRSPEPLQPYTVYALGRRSGSWDLVDRFPLSETDGTEAPDWALARAWTRLMEKVSNRVSGKMEKA